MTRVVVVTGTSSGLGAAVAARLLGDGYAVVGISRRNVSSETFGERGKAYVHIAHDLADIEGIPPLVKNLVSRFGTPYALVNNAASGGDGLLPTMHNADIEAVLQLDLMSPIILTKYVVRHMLVAREGRIVNISSIVAKTGYRGLSVYGAAKGGLEGFSRSLARDVGPRGVTVNCVAPGFLDTEMTASLGGDNLRRIRKRSPLDRFPTPDEVASAVQYLLTPDAAGVTGSVLTVDAGSTS